MLYTANGVKEIPVGNYMAPVVSNFEMTYQWLRELRQWNGRLRMVGVIAEIPDDELVWVGTYSQPKIEVTAAESVPLFEANPWGNEVLLTRDVVPGSIAIRSIRQDVGWQDTPNGHLDCVCPACLQPGHPKFMRRINAVYREATASGDLWRAQDALERARGRLPANRLLARVHEDPKQVASMLHLFKWPEVEQTLRKLLESPDEAVRIAAASSVLRSLPLANAMAVINEQDSAIALEVCKWLRWQEVTDGGLAVLSRLLGHEDPSVRASAAAGISVCDDQLVDDL